MLKPRAKRRDPGDDKTNQIHLGVRRLLADRDYDSVTVSDVARDTDMSVGAVYTRFPDKNGMLDSVVAAQLALMTRDAMDALDPSKLAHRSAQVTVSAIVRVTVRGIDQNAGVIRAALKRGHLDRRNLAALTAYREALSARAVELLTPHVRSDSIAEAEIRGAMQITQAAALDGLLYGSKAPLRGGSPMLELYLSTVCMDLLDL